METNMTSGKPMPILFRFVLPLFIGNVFQQLYNMADTIIVGRFVGQNALAAVGATGTIMFLMLGLANGLATGFAVLTSQGYGADDRRLVRRSVANAILLALIVTATLTIVFSVLMKPMLRLMNTPEDIFQDSYTYIIIICYGIFASIFYNLSAALMRAVGNSKVPLFFLILSACLNVVLDLVLIIVFGMGVGGAALATVISQGTSAALCFVYIWRKVPILKPQREDWRLHKSIAANQMRVGIPMALQFAITASGTMIMQSAVNLFGSTAVAGFTASSKLESLLNQGMLSMGQAMATYAGQNFGDRQYKRIREGVRAALTMTIIYAIAVALLGTVLLEPMVKLFFTGGTDLTELMPWAKTYSYLSFLFYVPLSVIFVFRNAMQGCGYGFLPMMGGVVELLARLITAFLSMHLASYFVACACNPAAWLSAAVFTGISYIFVMRDIERKYMEPADA